MLCYLTLILLMWRIGWAPNSIPIYIQQDATLHSLFLSGNRSTCFGWYFHPSSGVHITVSTAPGICHTFTAICRYRGRVGTGLSVLWVAYATHSRQLGRPRRRWEDNIKMDLQEVGGRRGDWMELAQDRDRWRTLVGTVRNFRVQ
jgi:hypothetical protein